MIHTISSATPDFTEKNIDMLCLRSRVSTPTCLFMAVMENGNIPMGAQSCQGALLLDRYIRLLINVWRMPVAYERVYSGVHIHDPRVVLQVSGRTFRYKKFSQRLFLFKAIAFCMQVTFTDMLVLYVQFARVLKMQYYGYRC